MRITLCRTQFDRENDNVLLFDSKEALKSYFDNLTDKVQIQKEINFNAKDIIRTVQYIDIPNEIALFKLLNYNYCYLDGNENDSRLYFFIERSYQDSGNQIRLELKADVWNTYIYDCMSSTKALQAMIQKTHLNRFIASGNDFIYNFASDSPLFERETIKDVAKRAVTKQRLKMQIDTTSKTSKFNNFINEYVDYWLYVFLDPNTTYHFWQLDGTEKNSKIETLEYIKNYDFNSGLYQPVGDLGLTVLCVPVFKQPINKTIDMTLTYSNIGNVGTPWNMQGIKAFLSQNNNYVHVQAIKLSTQPPLEVRNYIENTDYVLQESHSGNMDYITLKLRLYDNAGINKPIENKIGSNSYASLAVTEQLIDEKLILYCNEPLSNWTKTKAQIKTNEFEPKLENEDYSSYKIIFAGNEQTLPISKTSDNPEFIYKEAITPDITKSILIYNTNANKFTDSIFKNITESDFTGLQYVVDLSMWYYTDQLSNYLANNKNYLQIFQNEQLEKRLKAFVGAGYGTASGQELAGVAGLFNLTNTLINSAFDKAKLDLSLDNMQNAPGQLHNINSNPMLMNYVADLGFYIEKLEPLPFEQGLVKDNLKMFGYTYNRIGNIYNFAKTRKYYNYIQAIVFDIDAPICETIKDEIKQSFSRGIRIWHGDTITNVDFTVNNYERYLDNE